MTVMKNLKKFTRQFFSYLMIFSLVQTSIFVREAYALETSTVMNIAQQGLAVYGQYLGQKQALVMQRVMSAKNQQLMAQLSPTCVNPDKTACYAGVGAIFPECPIPNSMTNMPQNVCESATPDVNQIGQMITYETIAKGWMNYYDQMSNEASNMKVPVGLKCLQDKQKAVDSQITEMINNLTRLQDRLNKDKDTFRANTQKYVDAITKANEELNGVSKNNLDLKTKDFTKDFPSSCLSVFGDDVMKEAGAIGYNGLLKTVIPKNKDAADFNHNRPMIEADINRDIARIQQNMNDTGLEDWSASWQSGNVLESSKYAAVNTTIAKQNAQFQTTKARISKELSEIGYQVPAMDKNFAGSFDDFLAKSGTFFKKQFINSCVTGEDQTGVAIPTAQILAALEQSSTNNGGTARDRYRSALANIINSKAFIEDKLSQIKALESTYKDMNIDYRDASGRRVIETPYALYQRTIALCQKKFETGDQTSPDGVSYKKKVERGQQLLQELKGLHSSYGAKLSQLVLDKVLNCNGESKKAGSSCGDKSSFDPGSEGFCVAQASQCANEVQRCYALASDRVESRKTIMKNTAAAYNAQMTAMVARSNALYDEQKAAVMNMVKLIQTKFPGTNFEIPGDMFVKMPGMKSSAFGIDLVNDGNLAFLDELPKKIDLLKKVFRDQQARANDTISDYISKQTAAMATNRQKWEQLAEQCKGMIDSSSKSLAEANAQGQKAQNELDQKVANFCQKYAGLSENPLGACDDAKDLAETADKIQARLSGGVLQVTRQFKNACNQFNNESNELPEECEKDSDKLSKSQRQLCDSKRRQLARNLDRQGETGKSSKKSISLLSLCGAGNDVRSDAEFIKAAVAKFPEEDREALEGITTLKELTEKIDSEGIDDGDFFNNLKKLAGTDSTNSLCKRLDAISDAKLPPAPVHDAEKDNDRGTFNADTEKFNQEKKEIEEKKKQLSEVMVAFNDAITPAPTSVRDTQVAEVQNIGEQATQACDAQASNNSMPKIPGFDLQSFDKAILGTTR